MGIRDEYNLEYLVNQSEKLVLSELEQQLASPENADVCRCEDCVLDMAALSLNSVQPFYQVSLIGSLYAHALEDSPVAAKVHTAVSQAIEKVYKSPSHTR